MVKDGVGNTLTPASPGPDPSASLAPVRTQVPPYLDGSAGGPHPSPEPESQRTALNPSPRPTMGSHRDQTCKPRVNGTGDQRAGDVRHGSRAPTPPHHTTGTSIAQGATAPRNQLRPVRHIHASVHPAEPRSCDVRFASDSDSAHRTTVPRSSPSPTLSVPLIKLARYCIVRRPIPSSDSTSSGSPRPSS